MVDEATRERLAGTIRAAALDRTLWPAVLDALHAAMPGVAVHLFGQAEPYSIPLFTLEAGYDPAQIATYDAHYGALNAWAPSFMSNPAGTVLLSRQMCPDDDLERTEFYQDWIRPQEDIVAGGGAVIDHGPDAVLLMGGNIRRRDRDALEDEWMRLCAWALPRIQHAWRVNCRLAEAAIGARAVRGTDADDGPTPGPGAAEGAALLVIGPGGRIRHHDDAARTLLAAGRPLEVDPIGRLRGPPALARLLAAARAGGSASTRFRHHGGPWWAAAERVRDADFGDWPLAPALGLAGEGVVLLLGPERERPDPAARVAARLGLSPSEGAIALLLAEGLTPEEIAASRGASLHTVRDQIKSACGKLGLRRQLDLAVRAAGAAGGGR